MPTFVYKARNPHGNIITGRIDAESEVGVFHRLKRQNLVPLGVSLYRKSITEIINDKLKEVGWIGLGQVALFSRQLSTLINAGIPIVQCLNILINQIPNRKFKEKLIVIRADIEKGESITQALSKHPKIFSELYTSMTKAGEIGGILDEVLERLAAYLESMVALRRKLITIITYPSIIILVAVGVVTFLLIKVVPMFKDVYEQFAETGLPLPTQILIKISYFLKDNILWIILGTGLVIGILRIIIAKNERARYIYDNSKFKIPIIGDLFRKVAIGRFARTLGTLVKSGVPILEGLDIVAKTAGNKVVEKAVLSARSSIREGERISEPLSSKGTVFPPMVTQMVAVGEETGALDAMLIKVADYYDKEVDAGITQLTSIIEPILIVILGVIVGAILICMYLPIFNLATLF